MRLTNYRLELAFLIPDDKKLTVNEVKATVTKALDAITKDTLKEMKTGAVRFHSLDDLIVYNERVKKVKHQWNKEMKERQKNGTSSGTAN